MEATMIAAFLPGDSTVEMRTVPVPEAAHGEVLVRVKASTICGSDIRCIYHEHLGKGPEGYQNVIAGHEPAGQIVATGPGCRRFKAGDRVIVYHISGCGVCNDCRRGLQACSRQRLSRSGIAIRCRGRCAGRVALPHSTRRVAQVRKDHHSAPRADHRQARPDRSNFLRLHYQDRTHDSLHFNLFRTRLRLLECRSGTTTTASDGCLGRKVGRAIVAGIARKSI